MPSSSKIAEAVHRPRFHVATAAAFVLVNVLGYRFAGGLTLLQG